MCPLLRLHMLHSGGRLSDIVDYLFDEGLALVDSADIHRGLLLSNLALTLILRGLFGNIAGDINALSHADGRIVKLHPHRHVVDEEALGLLRFVMFAIVFICFVLLGSGSLIAEGLIPLLLDAIGRESPPLEARIGDRLLAHALATIAINADHGLAVIALIASFNGQMTAIPGTLLSGARCRVRGGGSHRFKLLE